MKNKLIGAVVEKQESRRAEVRLTSGSWKDAVHYSCESLNTSRLFVLGASNICLVGENLACFVPAEYGRESPWSYDYGHSQNEYNPPPTPPDSTRLAMRGQC